MQNVVAAHGWIGFSSILREFTWPCTSRGLFACAVFSLLPMCVGGPPHVCGRTPPSVIHSHPCVQTAVEYIIRVKRLMFFAEAGCLRSVGSERVSLISYYKLAYSAGYAVISYVLLIESSLRFFFLLLHCKRFSLGVLCCLSVQMP